MGDQPEMERVLVRLLCRIKRGYAIKRDGA